MRARLLPAVVAFAAGVLTGCTGESCDALPGLTSERDAARAAYAALTSTGTATAEQTSAADEAVHALDRRVYDLEQSCAR